MTEIGEQSPKEDAPKPNSPSVVIGTQTIGNAGQSTGTDYGTENDKKKSRKIWRWWGTYADWAMVIVTGIALAVTIALFNIASKQTDIAKDATEAAKVSADATRKSVDIAEQTLKIDTRPWVCLLV